MREELKSEIAKNNGFLQAMKDQTFSNPNKELEETYKNIEILKHKSKLNELWKKKQDELNELKLQQSTAISDDELSALVNQHIEAMKQDDELSALVNQQI